MRIATWNLDARWTAKHAAFLHDQAADVWCLTEVPARAIAGGRIVGYTAVGSTGRMSRGQHYAVVAARVAPTAARCLHPATVVADVGGIAVASSVLPWRGAGSQPGAVWAGDRLVDWLANALAAIRVSGATVWGGAPAPAAGVVRDRPHSRPGFVARRGGSPYRGRWAVGP